MLCVITIKSVYLSDQIIIKIKSKKPNNFNFQKVGDGDKNTQKKEEAIKLFILKYIYK